MRFRRALSLAIDRSRDQPGALFRPGAAEGEQHGAAARARSSARTTRRRWAQLRPQGGQPAARRDRPDKRGADGIRLLPDGRPLEIIVETAGESTEQTDVLELIRETWREVGIKLFPKPSQREVLPQPRLLRRDADVGLDAARERPRRPPT